MEPPLLASLVNGLLSLLVGMVLWGVRSINTHLKAINGRLSGHIEDKNLHYAAQARTEEQIRNLLQTVTVAHKRIDHVEETLHGKT